MKRWALYDPNEGTDYYNTRAEAVTEMTDRINNYLGDGAWDQDVEELHVAQITDVPTRTNIKYRADMTPEAWDDMTNGADGTEWWEYTTTPVGIRNP